LAGVGVGDWDDDGRPRVLYGQFIKDVVRLLFGVALSDRTEQVEAPSVADGDLTIDAGLKVPRTSIEV